METGDDGYVNRVQIGRENAGIVLGHVFGTRVFSRKFVGTLEAEYQLPETG